MVCLRNCVLTVLSPTVASPFSLRSKVRTPHKISTYEHDYTSIPVRPELDVESSTMSELLG